MRNILGWCIDHEPGPTLLVLPDQKSAEELFDERLRPLIEHTPAVGRHATGRAWDVKKRAIRFDTMSVYAAWAGSSQSTKSRPIRYAFCDEIDEYPPHSGGGGDPISKVRVRLTTFSRKGRARMLLGGTPTTRLGNVCKHFELANERRYFWVPCPHCGKYQQLAWSRIKWPSKDDLGETDRARQAARITGEDLAWYECEHCAGKIIERQHKSAMLARWVVAGEDQAVASDGRVVGPSPKSKRKVAFHYPATYSPWVRWSQLAAEFIAAQDDPAALMDFVNQRLAEPWEEKRARTQPDIFVAKATGAAEPRTVPPWAKVLIATADTQGSGEADGYFWYVVRAWGWDFRSQLVDYGVAKTKAELLDRTINKSFPIVDSNGVTSGLGLVTPAGIWIDSGGHRYSEIYQLAQADPRIHPTKGSSHTRTWMVSERPQKSHGIVLWEIETEQAKDLLHRLVNDPDPLRFMVHRAIAEDYGRQMCAEAKILDPASGRERWVEIIKNLNHIWDCEATGTAVAWRLGCGMQEPQQSSTPQQHQPIKAGTGDRPGWMPQRPSNWAR